jgi:hypothetical protein
MVSTLERPSKLVSSDQVFWSKGSKGVREAFELTLSIVIDIDIK